MFDKLEDLVKRLDEVMQDLSEPDVVSDQNRFRNLMKEQNELAPIVEKYKEYKEAKQTIEDSVEMLEEEHDEEMRELLKEELSEAKKNAENLNASVTLIRGNLFENIEGRFDYILSNPPYIPSQVIQGLMPEVKDHEPRLALDGEEDGLAFYRKIIEQAPDYLNSNGRIYFEIGAEQGEDMIRLMTDRGFSEVKVHKDLAGLDRIATGIYSRR